MSARRNRPTAGAEAVERGTHTLRVYAGTIVGISGNDVFVELGPRMQGVISRRAFEEEPEVGAEHEFTLHGQEESLWVLSLRHERSLTSWQELEVGSVVAARVIRAKPGGLELMVGALHAFMPNSQTGLERGKKASLLIGKKLVCEVVEVDAERQRAVLSRKAVLKREKQSAHQRELGRVVPGSIVHGRVTRIESYGAFVRFGHGQNGLIHVSDLSHRRVERVEELLKLGQSVEAKVLSVRQMGKRIGLGLKQLVESPWKPFAREHGPGDVLAARVRRIKEFGGFVEVRAGVEGLLPRGESGAVPGEPLRSRLQEGQELAVRILTLDPDLERMTLSVFRPDGSPLVADEVVDATQHLEADGGRNGTDLGRLLRHALDEGVRDVDPRRRLS